ncbi:putative glycosyltransferase EpsJ [Lactobacillus helveticus]|uniref:glycosyltransferase family 2 protein n=1 Tax=Lactobacillus helveticus TaxID=1587 RepID=UPI001562DABA|nr:glycosyltransferase [Lactobacillus helveticus]NRO31583.1 putative glycosyltransferase EpsJ [Lactobacillus helveticus]
MIEKPFILLSVIIPIYNVDKYLRKCLTTCLSHNNAIEYILVDDGSTDDSLKIAKDYTKAYKNIVVIHQKNMGLSAARNTGLKSAIGKWIYFIDSDDFVSEKYIDNMYNLLKKVDSKINLINLPVKKFINGKEIEIQNGNNELVKSMNFAESILNDDRQMGVWSYVFKNRYLKKKKSYLKKDFFLKINIICHPLFVIRIMSMRCLAI